jgi:hypothetical protein
MPAKPNHLRIAESSEKRPVTTGHQPNTAYCTPRAPEPDRKGNGGAPGHAEDQLTRSQRLADLPAWPARVGRVRSALGRHQLRQLHDHHPPSEGLARVEPPTSSVTSSKVGRGVCRRAAVTQAEQESPIERNQQDRPQLAYCAAAFLGISELSRAVYPDGTR